MPPKYVFSEYVFFPKRQQIFYPSFNIRDGKNCAVEIHNKVDQKSDSQCAPHEPRQEMSCFSVNMFFKRRTCTIPFWIETIFRKESQKEERMANDYTGVDSVCDRITATFSDPQTFSANDDFVR